MADNISKDALNAINKKTGKKITEGAVKKLASTVKPSTLQNEDQLRTLIKQVSAMAKVPVSEETIQEIVNAIKKSGMNPSNMEAIMKMMMKKK
ncbi:stage VI sporulation protein F [Paenibacillus polygoni]|uniref:Stage VI sporulation protein F n=1 Tax=Paenibacillus polygoni TaxID=3050112 RepID=A0ABY8WXW6_9BACL|nr:stage VI sporulation protein F [Paenibacillus polygoni]WIV17972.1 stage VI sporulation protein F [Paenibacillus polygoni]